jgi:hypothetical protein
MADTSMVPSKRDGGKPVGRPLVGEELLADQLLGNAQAEGVELLGPWAGRLPDRCSYVARGHGDAVGYLPVVEENRASPEGPEQRAAGTVLGCR